MIKKRIYFSVLDFKIIQLKAQKLYFIAAALPFITTQTIQQTKKSI